MQSWETILKAQNFKRYLTLPQTAEECQLDVEDLTFNDYIFVIGKWLVVERGR